MAATPVLQQLTQFGEVLDPQAYQLDGLTPQLALAPLTIDALRDVLHVAAEAGLAVVPWGGGTHIGLGNVPRAFDLALDLRHLNHIVSYTPHDLTVAVEAGVTVATLQRELGRHGQMLPLDCATPERTTIGGLVASGLGGPRRYGYGSLRDLLIGITVALPNGQLSRGGGMVVKNVSGYDMMRLHYGALGSFGVIVQVNFKVLPAPRAQRTVLAGYATLDQAADLAMAVRTSQLAPTALIVLNASAQRTLGEHVEGWSVALRCEGPPQAVERQAERISALVREHGGREWVLDDQQTEQYWARVASLIDAAPCEQGLRVRIGERPSSFSDIIPTIEAACTAVRVHPTLVLDVGSGLGYVTIDDELPPVAFQRLWERLCTLGQHVTLLRAPAAFKAGIDVFGRSPASLAVLRALKATFDPSAVLNPGRYVGKL
ncbi:FAD-binding oxidoreductase [Thermorudis peleae]|uniref:FAD-binding oxidoreductase n=1 Tax=Thermorudis peleae TaxID=1382356 RepID=UPI00056FE28C|nr:FAD-binding oxidoreductase [Thermorudis peleae]